MFINVEVYEIGKISKYMQLTCSETLFVIELPHSPELRANVTVDNEGRQR